MTEYTEEQIANIKTESKAEILGNISNLNVSPSNSTSHAARKPPIFCDGDDINSYLETWANYARILKIPDADKGRLLLTFLDTTSNEKMNAAKLSSNDKNDWITVKKELKNVLETDNEQQARAKLFALRQNPGETIEEFGRRLTKLATRAYGTDLNEINARDLNIKDKFVYGLQNNSIALNLMAKMEKSYAELYKEACNLEKNLETRKQTHNTGDIEILTTETGKLTVPLNKTKDTCFNCGAAGHWAHSCTELKKETRTCHYCNKVGHIKPKCFKFLKDTGSEKYIDRRSNNYNTNNRPNYESNSYSRSNYRNNSNGRGNYRGSSNSRGNYRGSSNSRGNYEGNYKSREGTSKIQGQNPNASSYTPTNNDSEMIRSENFRAPHRSL